MAKIEKRTTKPKSCNSFVASMTQMMGLDAYHTGGGHPLPLASLPAGTAKQHPSQLLNQLHRDLHGYIHLLAMNRLLFKFLLARHLPTRVSCLTYPNKTLFLAG